MSTEFCVWIFELEWRWKAVHTKWWKSHGRQAYCGGCPGLHCKSATDRQNQDRSRLSSNHRRSWRDGSRLVLECNTPLVVADRRQCLLALLLTKCTRSQRYVGHSECSILWHQNSNFEGDVVVDRYNQWSFLRTGVIWALWGSQWSFFRTGCNPNQGQDRQQYSECFLGVPLLMLDNWWEQNCSCRCAAGRVISQDVTLRSELQSSRFGTAIIDGMFTTLFTCWFLCSSLSKR